MSDCNECERHNEALGLRPVAMCTVLLSTLSPAEDNAKAFSHALASGYDVARRWAWVASYVGYTVQQVLSNGKDPGRSHTFCDKLAGAKGGGASWFWDRNVKATSKSGMELLLILSGRSKCTLAELIAVKLRKQMVPAGLHSESPHNPTPQEAELVYQPQKSLCFNVRFRMHLKYIIELI